MNTTTPISFFQEIRQSKYFVLIAGATFVSIMLATLYTYNYFTSAQTLQVLKFTSAYSTNKAEPKSTEQKLALSLTDLLYATEDAKAELTDLVTANNENPVEQSSWDSFTKAIGLGDSALADLSYYEDYQDQIENDKTLAIASFKEVEDHLVKHNLPEEIMQRHQAAVATYEEKHQALNSLITQVLAADSLNSQQENITELNVWLAENQTVKTHQEEDFDNLPFGAPKEINTKPAEQYSSLYDRVIDPVVVASTDVNGAMIAQISPEVTPADLVETIDAPQTQAIIDLAAELKHDPIAIYDWVYNNIQFIPSYGSIQGAEMTRQLGKGNATDTASLLIALLRASNIAARYAYGTVDIPVDQVMNWVGGVEVPEAAQSLLGQGGIPNTLLLRGGKAEAIRMEHMWVEAWVDFEPSRGIKNNEGDSWIPLDASFKQYEYTEAMDLQAAVPFDAEGVVNELIASGTTNEQEGWIQSFDTSILEQELAQYQTQLEDYITNQNPNVTVNELLGLQEIKVIPHAPLSAGLPYQVIARTQQMTELSNSIRHKFKFELEDKYYGRFIAFEKSTVELAGKPLALSFKPATDADKQLILSYLPDEAKLRDIDPSMLTNELPGYLINLLAEFSINGESFQTSNISATMGSELNSTMGLWSPSHGWNLSDNNPISGEYHAIALDLQGVSLMQINQLHMNLEDANGKNLRQEFDQLTKHSLEGNMLYASILSYFSLNNVQDYLAVGYSKIINNRMPSYGVFMTGATTQYWFGIARNVNFSGLIMDVDAVVNQSVSKINDSFQVASFRKNIGLRYSLMENLIPEQFFASEGIISEGASATKALSIANSLGQKIYKLDKSNSEQLINIEVNQESRSEIRNALNQGKEVTIHEKPISINGWKGSGYIITDPDSGGGAYKISGGFNGGVFSKLFSIFDYYKTFSQMLDAIQWCTNVNHGSGGETFTKNALKIIGVTIAFILIMAVLTFILTWGLLGLAAVMATSTAAVWSGAIIGGILGSLFSSFLPIAWRGVCSK